MEVVAVSVIKLNMDICRQVLDQINGGHKDIRMIQKLFDFMMNKYSSRILLGLLKLEFSTLSELSNLADVDDNRCFQSTTGSLIRAGLVVSVTKNSESYEFILKFWKDICPNSSRPPAFYSLNSKWVKTIESIENILFDCHNNKRSIDIPEINRRMDRYRSFCAREKDKMSMIEDMKKNSMGQCHECGRYIKNDAERGNDYHKFPVGLICGFCNKRETDRSKWMRANR